MSRPDTIELNGLWCGLGYFDDTCGITHAVFMTGTIELIDGKERFYRLNKKSTHDWVVA